MKNTIRYYLLCCFIFASLDALANEYRTFTSSDGQTIEAKVVDAKRATDVTIELKDGRVFKRVPLSRFSKDDQRYVEKWLKDRKKALDNAELTSDSDIEISFQRGKDSDENDYGDIDDIVIQFEPTVIIENNDLTKTYRNVQGTVVVVGVNHPTKKKYVVLSEQDFKITLPSNEKTSWKGKRFSCYYDPDYTGYKYGGYLVVLKDDDGQVIFSKASKSHWESFPNRLLKAKDFYGYDSKFENGMQLMSTFGLPSATQYQY